MREVQGAKNEREESCSLMVWYKKHYKFRIMSFFCNFA